MALAMVLWAFAAQAEPQTVNLAQMTLGYTYFNRPGADPAVHNADIAACALEASKVHSLDEVLGTGNEGVVGALVQGALGRAAHHALAAASLENCMVVRGWRVVVLPESEGLALAELTPAALAARLEPWIGAADPHGQVVRVWGNDAAKPSSNRFAYRPQHTNNGQLSLIAATASDLKQFKAFQSLPPSKPVLDPRWPTKPLKPQGLAAAPTDGGVILVQIKGLSLHNGIGLAFSRMGPDRYTNPSVIDHGPDSLVAAKPLLFAHKDGDMFAFAAPAGRWRLYGMEAGLIFLNFCLGSPSFELKSGDVVYAGSFDLGADPLAPNLDLGLAKDWLAGQPQAEKVQAAVYANGAEGACGDNSIYALELPGASFTPGYAWGSLALTPNSAASTAPAGKAPVATPAALSAPTQ